MLNQFKLNQFPYLALFTKKMEFSKHLLQAAVSLGAIFNFSIMRKYFDFFTI